MAGLTTWLRSLGNVLFPHYCAVCGNPLGESEQKLCGACLFLLPYLPIHDLYDNPICRLFWGRIPIERGHSHLHYVHDSPSHPLLMQLKYLHRPDVARWMGQQMGRDLLPSGFFQDIDAIIPVPLHWRRQWHRGYNQSRQLALGLSEATGLPVLRGVVRRIHNNESQTSMSASERMQNVTGIFRARSGLAAHHVLLVDDVLTTGATLTALADAISEANPSVVFSILTLAKA